MNFIVLYVTKILACLCEEKPLQTWERNCQTYSGTYSFAYFHPKDFINFSFRFILDFMSIPVRLQTVWRNRRAVIFMRINTQKLTKLTGTTNLISTTCYDIIWTVMKQIYFNSHFLNLTQSDSKKWLFNLFTMLVPFGRKKRSCKDYWKLFVLCFLYHQDEVLHSD